MPVQVAAGEHFGSLCQVERIVQTASPTPGCEARELSELLREFEDVFSEPSELPPHRDHDHHIVLRDGTMPVNVRPSIYSVFQTNEIEMLIQ